MKVVSFFTRQYLVTHTNLSFWTSQNGFLLKRTTLIRLYVHDHIPSPVKQEDLKRFGSKDVGNKTNLARRESQNIVIYLYLQRKARFAILQELLLRRNIFSGVGSLPRKGKTSFRDYVKRPSNRHLV